MNFRCPLRSVVLRFEWCALPPVLSGLLCNSCPSFYELLSKLSRKCQGPFTALSSECQTNAVKLLEPLYPTG